MECLKKYKTGGFVTVPAAIILAAVCLFQLVLTDASAVISSRHFYAGRVKISSESVLASYDSILFSKYALLGLNITSYEGYETDLIRYLSEPVQTGVLKLSRSDKRSCEMSLCDPLSDPEALKKSITANMKYRTVANGALFLAQALGLIGEAGSFTGAARYVAEGEKILSQAKTKIETLKQKIEGFFTGDRNCVNGYSGIITDLALRFGSVLLKVTSVYDILTGAESLKEALGGIYTDIRFYAGLNVDALDLIAELKKCSEDIRKAVSKARNEIADVSDEETRRDLEKRIAKLESESIRISNDGLIEPLKKNVVELNARAAGIGDNIEVLDRLISEGGSYLIDNEPDVSTFVANIRKVFDSSGIKTDLKVSPHYVDAAPGLSELDPRNKGNADDSIYSSDSYEIESGIYASLPSVRANAAGSYAEILTSFEDLDQVIETLSNLAGSFSVSSALQGAADKILICDYVSSYFSDITAVSGSGIENSFQCEKEYVIGGSRSSDDNVKNVSNKLIAIRFLFNFMHCYSDEEKHTLASEIGNSIAALISAGAGGELYAFLIICAWSMAESYVDVKALRNGEKVLLIKSAATWKTSIEGLAGSAQGEDASEEDGGSFGLDYSQYMILLMLLMPTDTVLLRAADVIEVNMTDYTGHRYMLSGVFTGIRCKVSYVPVVISPLFKLFGRERLEYEIEEKVTY